MVSNSKLNQNEGVFMKNKTSHVRQALLQALIHAILKNPFRCYNGLLLCIAEIRDIIDKFNWD
ncbi:hypothetical protein VIAG107301_20280 [Vibrio agarivorans]